MDIEKAKTLLDGNEGNLNEKNTLLRGLQILAKYLDDMDHGFSSDEEIWVDGFEETIGQMTKEEVILMAKLGWSYDEDSDIWTHY
ncbi:MAG: hypothetical protein A3J65_02640 [Candidatus Buchananbacteria bacterium RIFCSPHIGHO2_02_FULL_45_11b]|uniref:Uncharacterized protein n=2 Tax=Candidatus Buchananiibacteriota TaxID=1817903 RepID=A0A1G1YEF0_9BACT|nr:MAG: hypothetical protein A3J65_02640 [Candidatus Buchananbacteria bacterium RIFCSPHIGHO2_02_FULL_45_11b]OGY55819.1 MAG: hypothetical protein A3H67_01395 [Candidatus Buchananbacteria bacterium RIFCSPLOWO2_02_FULL_46_11b]